MAERAAVAAAGFAGWTAGSSLSNTAALLVASLWSGARHRLAAIDAEVAAVAAGLASGGAAGLATLDGEFVVD
jgi:hypothetical protein